VYLCRAVNTAVTLTVYHQSGSPKSGYRSAWEQLLSIHTARVPDTDSGRTSTTDRAIIREPTPTTAARATPFPSPILPQHHNQTNKRTRAYGRLQSREVRPSAQPVSSGTQVSQGAFRQRNRTRPTIPGPHQGPSTSWSVSNTDGSTSSMNFRTSAFSFRIPDETNYPIHPAPQNDHETHSTPTGYHSDSHGSTTFIPPSSQTPAQMSTAPSRPSTYHPLSQRPKFLPPPREINCRQLLIFGKPERIRRDPQGIREGMGRYRISPLKIGVQSLNRQLSSYFARN